MRSRSQTLRNQEGGLFTHDGERRGKNTELINYMATAQGIWVYFTGYIKETNRLTRGCDCSTNW